MSAIHKLLVVGGNGYLGSAVCRAAVARGWSVSSISSSGNPAVTPAGHKRAWTNHVTWNKASAFRPAEYEHLLAESTAVVHTLGILMEGDYKKHVRSGNWLGLLGEIIGGGREGEKNPLMRGMEGKNKKDGFEAMNRDSAITVLQTLLSTLRSSPTTNPDKPFVYVSAENIFSPIVSPRYVETKREAERAIERLIWEYKSEMGGGGGKGARGVYVRPGLMYHPHERPLSTLPAVLLDITSTLSNHLPFSLFPRTSSSNLLNPKPSPFPLKTLSSLSSSLSVPPIHVDQVAECILRTIEHPHVKGIVDTKEMRRWIGLDKAEDGEEVVMPLSWEKERGAGQRGGHGKIPFPMNNGLGGTRSFSTTTTSRSRSRSGRIEGLKGRRNVTILAPGPSGDKQPYIIEPASTNKEGSSENVQTASASNQEQQPRSDHVIDAAAVISSSASVNGETKSAAINAGRSNHPYAGMAQQVSNGGPGQVDMEGLQNPLTTLPLPTIGSTSGGTGGDGNTNNTTNNADFNPGAQGEEPNPGEGISPGATTIPYHPTPAHPFDTHAFVTHLEKSGFTSPVSHSLMRTVRSLLMTRSTRAQTDLLHKEDVENAAYLFKAALSELRTELNVRARNDGLALRSATNLIRREVDALSQRMKEEVGGLKHDIEMDMNNRKGETRSEQKAYEISIEEINNKFTISLGDLKTEIEQAKWDATRRAIAILAALVFTVISVVTLTSDGAKPPPPPPATLPPVEKKYRDMAVGDDALNLREGDEEAMIRIRGLESLRR